MSRHGLPGTAQGGITSSYASRQDACPGGLTHDGATDGNGDAGSADSAAFARPQQVKTWMFDQRADLPYKYGGDWERWALYWGIYEGRGVVRTMGERLLDLRKRRGLSQEELAAQLSVSRQTISRWEMGTSKPDTQNILQLCKIFDVSADYLLSGGQPTVQPPPDSASRPANKGRLCRVAGMALGLMGALGHLAIWLLSTMLLLQAPNEAVPVGMEVIESGDTWVRDYGVFVEHYHLQALLGLLWACLAVGILLFAWGRVTKSKGQSRQP